MAIFFRLLGIVICIYFAGILIGALFPQNTKFLQEPALDSVSIYIRSNGFHSFLILPVQSPERNWKTHFPFHEFEGVDSSFTHISMGWGDKGFFMETPTWEDFSLETAFRALFLPSSSVMQVQFLLQSPQLDRRCVQISLSPDSYKKLCAYLDHTLMSPSDSISLIPGKGYTGKDNFYEANGKYSLMFTCNNWVNTGLKQAGVRTGMWTPIDRGLFYQLHKISSEGKHP